MIAPLSILEVAFSSAWGGLEMLVGQFACWFRDKGHSIAVISSHNPSLKEYLNDKNIQYKRINPYISYCDPVTAIKLALIIKKNKINIIHTHISKDLSTLLLAKKLAGRGALIFTQHMDSQYSKKDWFHQWVYKGIDLIITATDAMRDHQLSFTPARPDQVKRIYNGIDTERFQPIGYPKNELLQKYNIPGYRKVVSIIARLDRLKNQKIIVEAAPQIIKIHSDVLFLFVGKETPGRDGRGYQRELETAIKAAHLENYFKFLGFCYNVEEIISLSDIVVLTTPKESFGLVLIESMAMEKPVIGANGGGVPEIITDGVTGKLFIPYHADSLAGAVNSILNSPAEASLMGKRGRGDVVQRFSLQKNFELYEEQFYRIIDEK